MSSRLEFLATFSEKNFASSEAEDNNTELLNREGVAGTPLFGTRSNLSKVTQAKFLGTDRFFCFISTSTCGGFKNPFTMITGMILIFMMRDT